VHLFDHTADLGQAGLQVGSGLLSLALKTGDALVLKVGQLAIELIVVAGEPLQLAGELVQVVA
jgi:hypothetical protein